MIFVVAASTVIGVLAVAGSAWAMPLMQRPTLPFGVRVPAQHAGDEVIASQIRAFRTRTVVSGLIGLAAAIALGVGLGDGTTATELTSIVPIALLLFLVVLSYLHARRKVQRAKTDGGWYDGVAQRVVVDTTLRSEPERVPWAWAAPALLLPFVTLAVGIALYPGMPERVPMRSNGSEVVSWQTKSPWVVAVPVLIELAVTLLLVGLVVWSYRARADLEPAAPKRSATQHRLFLRRIGRAVLVMAAVANASLLIAFPSQWRGHTPGPWSIAGIILCAVAGAAYVIVVSVRAGQGGNRIDTGIAAEGDGREHADDDRYWRAGGLVYVNRADPALMVQKRVGVGWTVNLGNPWGMVALGVLLVLVVASVVLPQLAS